MINYIPSSIDSSRTILEELLKINKYLKENPETSVLMITHYSRIFKYLKPEYVHIMMDGNIKKTGDVELAYEIEKDG